MEGSVRHKQLHGHRVAYRLEGSGPVVVLVHGKSAKPRGDYSLGAYASGIRDLLVALGLERATFVGHSLGGGVAMQLSYQFPELCERLVLVDSGGLGREVSLLLRSATLPGSELVLPLLARPQLLDAGRAVGRWLNRVGLGVRTDIEEIARGHASLADREAREAFVHTLRSIIEPGGQRVSATDRLYLAENMPFLIIWGARDKVIPVQHGRSAHRQVPDSRPGGFPEAGHFSQLDEPERFVETLTRFIESTEPSEFDPERLRRLL